MKKLILATLALTASTVFASEVVVLDKDVRYYNDTHFQVGTRFYMDQESGQGYVKAFVSERRSHYRGRGDFEISYYPLLSETVKVEGLVLMGDQAVYQGAEGNVVCGTMGVSRVFKVPTLYLTGNCKLSGAIRREGRDNKVLVKLITK